jgi:hypothetical protein
MSNPSAPKTREQLWEQIQNLGSSASVSPETFDSSANGENTQGAAAYSVSFDPQQSSDIAAAEYDVDRSLLTITFRKQDRIYLYSGVTRDVWDAFILAPSPGKFFNAKLRGVYPFERLK